MRPLLPDEKTTTMTTKEIENNIEALQQELNRQTNDYKSAISDSKVFREVKPMYLQAHVTELKILALKADHLLTINKELEGFERWALSE
jgi:hypothetical protein